MQTTFLLMPETEMNATDLLGMNSYSADFPSLYRYTEIALNQNR